MKNGPLKPGTLVEFVGLSTLYFGKPYGFNLASIDNWRIDSLFTDLSGVGMLVEVCPDKVLAENMIPALNEEIGSNEYYLYKVLLSHKKDNVAGGPALIIIYSFFVRPLSNSV